ncbi:MAG TPA: PQQ-dependent sugar dehydrogenase, partial [Nitrososphaeraceae archaeon]|nr:PQQ-dependent sugar dehydrogenase [Nitrososphaeraceae archaeon]
LDFPTTMAFLGPNDFLILEKAGTVKRVTDGKVLDKPLLQVDVNVKDERGLLGIAVNEKKKNANVTSIPNKDITHNVFLYYVVCNEKNEDCKNQIYRYDLDNKNNILVNPKLLLSIPSFPAISNINGIIRIGPDDNLYVTMGSFQNNRIPSTIKNKALNFEDGNDLDGRGGILRITQDGKPVNDGNGSSSIIGDNYPLNLYYAYGIRNSFGLDFDPLTDKLWDTEIGPQFGDEINLV